MTGKKNKMCYPKKGSIYSSVTKSTGAQVMRSKYTAFTVFGIPAGFLIHNYKLLVSNMCAEHCGTFRKFAFSKMKTWDERKYF